MTYPYQLVVFDWEGTIADPLGALVHYLWTNVNQQGWAAFSQLQVRHHLLQGLPKAVHALFPGLSEQQVFAMVERAERMVLQNVLVQSELQAYFKVVRCAGPLPAKPNPQMLIEILDAYAIEPAQVVMVGDSFADIEMAKIIHVDAIAVDWYASGMWHPDRMGAKAVVSTVEHLSTLLGIQLPSGEKIEQGV